MSMFDIIALSIEFSAKKRLASYFEIAKQYNKMAVALMGKEGSAVQHNQNFFYQKAKTVEVVDTTGAGDAYLAAFLVEYHKTKYIISSMEKATKVASQVIIHIGSVV